jgi:hypothetical protein
LALFIGERSAVLNHETNFPEKPDKPRKWTDTLFCRVLPQFESLFESLLPNRRIIIDLRTIDDHEDIASFICAFTALCVVGNQYVAVGEPSLGYIILPPVDYWGKTESGNEKWAWNELNNNFRSVNLWRKDAIIHSEG